MLDSIKLQHEEYKPLLINLEQIYSDMDHAYTRVARHYGFNCTGCVDNCCFTLFHHHTLLEYLYLQEGVAALDLPGRMKILKRAAKVCKKVDESNNIKANTRILCPLNKDGSCVLYQYRPMICRLHGLPHEFRKPGMEVIYGSGCNEFVKGFGKIKYFTFDRTPFYTEIAHLEQELRQLLGFSGKIKMTVAQILRDVDEIK